MASIWLTLRVGGGRRACGSRSSACTQATLIAVVLSVVGYHGPVPASGSGPEAAKAPVQAGTPGPVSASSKPHGSGVALRYVLPPDIRPGQTINVKLSFSNITADDGARVVVRIIEPRRQLADFYVQKGEERTLDLPLTTSADGTLYLAVSSTQAGRTSVQVVPVRVGSGKVVLQPQGTRRITPSGESVTSLPAGK